jgi:hypothetical protein
LLRFPYTLAVDPVSGSLLVGDAAADQLFRVDLETGAQELVASTPWLLAIVGLGGALVTAPLRRIELATGDTTPLRVFGAAVLRARCSDGIDNDRDGATDWPADPGCLTPTQDGEHGPGCGLGAELTLALALLGRAGKGIRRVRDPAQPRSRSPRHATNAVAATAKSSHSAESAT